MTTAAAAAVVPIQRSVARIRIRMARMLRQTKVVLSHTTSATTAIVTDTDFVRTTAAAAAAAVLEIGRIVVRHRRRRLAFVELVAGAGTGTPGSVRRLVDIIAVETELGALDTAATPARCRRRYVRDRATAIQ